MRRPASLAPPVIFNSSWIPRQKGAVSARFAPPSPGQMLSPPGTRAARRNDPGHGGRSPHRGL